MKLRFALLILSLLTLQACVEKKSKSKSTTKTNTPLVTPTPTPTWTYTYSPTPTPTTTNTGGPINTSCNAPGVGNSQLSDYYRIPAIIRGKGGPGLNWSTLTEPFFSADNQNLLITDSRLNARIVVRPSPGGGPGATLCRQMAMEYTKLSFRVGLKASSNAPTYYQTRSFSNIAVDQCSSVIEFLTPAVNNPLVVEVYDIRWDACVDGPGTCAVDYVWPYDCVEIEVQISTDYTKDIPH